MSGAELWRVVADVVVPVAAVLVSAGVAVWLARRERLAASKARDEERVDAARERALEREQVEVDRIRMKTEATFEQVGGTLAWFISASPVQDEWQSQMRLLRGQAKVAQAVPASEAQDFAFWFASEVERGLREAARAFAQFEGVRGRLTDEYIDAAVDQIMDPFRSWANLTMDLVVMWLRGSTSLEGIRQIADGAARLRWDAARIQDRAERNGGPGA